MDYTKKQSKVSIPITSHTFEAILNYLISMRIINRKFIHNIQQLLDIIDTRPYSGDDYDLFLLNAIQFVAKVRENGVNNLNYIKTSIEQSDLDQNFVEQLYQNLAMATSDMSKEEYDNLSEAVSLYVDYAYIFYSWPLIVSAHDTIVNTTGRISRESISKIKNLYEGTLSKIRISDSARDCENTVCIGPKSNKTLRNEISRIYDDANDPCNIFVTGLKELNRFLNGGYRRKRMYIFYAPTNSFKSGILLYNALWIMTFNPEIKPKYPNKKLAIVMITMENTVDETMDRIHAIYTAGQVDPREISKDEYLKQWDGIFEYLNTNFRLYIRYKQPGTTSVGIETEIQELEEDENVEVCCVIIDHLGNMGKTDRSVDDRKGMINTAYELSDWAKQTDRMVLTAMHTNSNFDDIRAEAEQNGKTNLVRMMGRHCIADAKYIDRAVDQSIYLLKERSPIDGSWYLGFKYEKIRSKKSSGSNIFYHRLENEITLRYDQGSNVCNSFPCIPGTENSVQIAQAEANGIVQSQTPFNNVSVMPPPPMPQKVAPFGNSNVGNGVSSKMSRPMPLSINQPTPFDITTVRINTPIPTSFDTVDDVNFTIGDFGVDSDEWFIDNTNSNKPASELLSEEDDSMYDYEDDDLKSAMTDDDDSIYIGED